MSCKKQYRGMSYTLNSVPLHANTLNICTTVSTRILTATRVPGTAHFHHHKDPSCCSFKAIHALFPP